MICICESPNILSSFFFPTHHYNTKDFFSLSTLLVSSQAFFLAGLLRSLFNYHRSHTQLISRSFSKVTSVGNFNAWSALPNDFIQRNRSAICIQRFDPVNSWSFIPCLPIKEAVDRSKQFQSSSWYSNRATVSNEGTNPLGAFECAVRELSIVVLFEFVKITMWQIRIFFFLFNFLCIY